MDICGHVPVWDEYILRLEAQHSHADTFLHYSLH